MLQVYPVLCRADVMNNYAYVITDGRADLIKTIELEEYREQGDNDE